LANETMVAPAAWPERAVQSVDYPQPQAFQLPQVSQNESILRSVPTVVAAAPVVPTSQPVLQAKPLLTPLPVEVLSSTTFAGPGSPEQIRANMGRLPSQLNRDFQNWLGAVATGRKELLDMWYQGGAVAPTIWREGIVAAKGDTSTAIRQFDAQSGSDNDQQIQLGLVALVGDLCVRSAQTWKRLTGPSAGPMWRIVGERSITAPMSRCSL
jgi:hypothetical protein